MNPPAVPQRLEDLLETDRFVRALARSLLYGADGAEDVAQQAWVAALERPPREARSLRSWLATVARNLVRQGRRADARREARELAVARPEGVPSAEAVLEREALRRRVVAEVLALEEPYRAALLLRYFEDLPPREVARRLGVPVETARTRVRRGIERLRERLDARERGGRRAWALGLVPLVHPPRPAPAGPAAAIPAATGGAILLTTGTKLTLAAAVALLVAVLAWPRGETPAPRVPALPPPPATPAASVASSPAAAAPAPPAIPATAETPPRAPDPEAPATLVVRVLDPEGVACPGATVVLSPPGRFRQVEGAADAAGEARFDGLAVGRCLFGARPPAGREGLAAETRHATLAPGEKSRQELRFEEGNPVRGRILDAETGLAVAGARVRFWWPEWEVRTLADGDFAFPPVPKRERRAWIVFVEAEGYAWTRATGRNDDPAPITVRLERGARSVVKVVDEGGRPLAGARVRVHDLNFLWEPRAEGRADEDGRCVFDHLPAAPAWEGVVIATDAQGERLGTLRTFPNLPEGERREIPVTARPRTGRAEVQVLREGDRPAGRRVFLCLYPPDWVHRWLLDGKVARDALGRSNLPGEFVFQARTDGHGIARYEGLPPGEYLVEVPGVGDRSWALEVGDAPARLDLRLDEALPEEHVVRGVVRGRAGPLANLAVHLVAGKSVLGWAMTGPDGKFSVRTREWPPDRLVVWVPQGGGGPVRRDEFTLPNDLSQEIDLRVD